jgi:hypothetical protein
MSLGLEPLHLTPTIDPRIDIAKLEKLLYAVESGGSTVSYEKFPITNFGAGTINANLNPPNKDNIVSRRIYLEVLFELTFTGTISGPAGSATLIQAAGLKSSGSALANVSKNMGYNDAPRAWALSNSLSTLQVQLNGQPIQTNLNQYIRALTRYMNTPQCQDIYKSYIPSMLDQALTYEEVNISNRNPLKGYYDNMVETPRGGYWGAEIIQNDTSVVPVGAVPTAVIQLRLIEPLYLSPLGISCQDELPGFLGISTISLQATLGGRGNGQYGGLVGSLWSHSNGPGGSSQTTLTSAGAVIKEVFAYMQYFTPPLNMEIPKSLVYSYAEPYYVSILGTSIAPGAKNQKLSMQNTQLNGIPRMMYVWVAEQDATTSINTTDTYFAINNIQITWNSTPGVLSTASQVDLYNICSRNGTNLSYTQFNGKVGSVLCLKFGEDIQLNTTQSPGVLGSYQIQFDVLVDSFYTVAVVPQIGVLFIYDGTFTIDSGRVTKQINILSQTDVLNTKTTKTTLSRHPTASDALGGFSWGDVGNFFKKAGRFGIDLAKNIVPGIAPQFSPIVAGVDTLAKSLGFGKKRKPRGGAMSGGRKLTRREMMGMM